jgi:hypothetical protein
MRAAIVTEAQRIGATLVSSCSSDMTEIQFSVNAGTDIQQGRLWTALPDHMHYELLCRTVKKGAVYDRETELWVKCISQPEFDVYRAERQRATSDLVEQNRKTFLAIQKR